MNPHLTRRRILAAGTVAVMSGVVGLPRLTLGITADETVNLEKHPYIDAHSHVWSPDTKRWPLANNKTKEDLAPPSFTPEELLKLAHEQQVGRVVLIQHHTYHGWDNSYLIDCAARYPGAFVVTGMIDDRAKASGGRQPPDTIPAQMDALLKQRVKAFRITSWIYKDEWLASEGMAAMWKHAAKSGQIMSCLIDAKDLVAVDAMCGKHPDTNVVIDHFARIGVDGTIRDEDVKNLCGLARHKNVFPKLSAYYALGKKQAPYLDLVPMIRRVLDAYGPSRCMWASDAPYQADKGHKYGDSIALIRDRLDLSAGDKEQLLRKTAERVYFS
ncbi:MAG TPA: amidohydrolase family protein [Pirellulaceae bacterium]|nr:amidohydrolase family protein [Pirellulaceae bacterium]